MVCPRRRLPNFWPSARWRAGRRSMPGWAGPNRADGVAIADWDGLGRAQSGRPTASATGRRGRRRHKDSFNQLRRRLDRGPLDRSAAPAPRSLPSGGGTLAPWRPNFRAIRSTRSYMFVCFFILFDLMAPGLGWRVPYREPSSCRRILALQPQRQHGPVPTRDPEPQVAPTHRPAFRPSHQCPQSSPSPVALPAC